MKYYICIYEWIQRDGYSPYNAVFEFPYNIHNQQCTMVVTSVTGHLMETDMDPQFRLLHLNSNLEIVFNVYDRPWRSCDPIQLFDAPIRKSIPEVWLILLFA